MQFPSQQHQGNPHLCQPKHLIDGPQLSSHDAQLLLSDPGQFRKEQQEYCKRNASIAVKRQLQLSEIWVKLTPTVKNASISILTNYYVSCQRPHAFFENYPIAKWLTEPSDSSFWIKLQKALPDIRANIQHDLASIRYRSSNSENVLEDCQNNLLILVLMRQLEHQRVFSMLGTGTIIGLANLAAKISKLPPNVFSWKR